MNEKYNPAAFPSPRWEGWGHPEEGMTLRDYFAAKALQGILSNHGTQGAKHIEVANQAFHMADAMLKAREA